MIWSLLGRIPATARGIILLFIAIACFATGGYKLTSDAVMCGSEAMVPTDTCLETRRGTTEEKTYDQMKSEGALTSYILLGVGGLFGIVGVVTLVRSRKKPPVIANPVA